MAWLIQLARQTWQEPETAFRQLIGFGLPGAVVWQATVLMAILLVGPSGAGKTTITVPSSVRNVRKRPPSPGSLLTTNGSQSGSELKPPINCHT